MLMNRHVLLPSVHMNEVHDMAHDKGIHVDTVFHDSPTM